MPTEIILVDVSLPFVLLCVAPLGIVALISHAMNLQLESPILVGCFRTFLQLTILALVLRPIFVWGQEYWEIVVLYALFMLLITSYESVQRSTYYFPNMYLNVLACFVISISLVSVWTFGVIIRPDPVYNPQYVIPILGMLLGNSINGSSLSLKTMLTSLMEEAAEVELLLSFGGSASEASRRLIREAVRTGALPILNSMAVIGLVYIPGMMTGQILAGSDVMEAARYQMLIMYLASLCTFIVILMEVFLVLRVGFDLDRSMLRTDRFCKRESKRSFIQIMSSVWASAFPQRNNNKHTFKASDATHNSNAEREALYGNEPLAAPPYAAISQGELQVRTLWAKSQRSSDTCLMEVSDLQCTLASSGLEERKLIFEDVSFRLGQGEICLVSGPSGAGKSTLLRVIAGLTPQDSGVIQLASTKRQDFGDFTEWRRRVRYVTQYKIAIPGTPVDLVRRFAKFQSWKSQYGSEGAPPKNEVLATCRQLLQTWGMEAADLEKEWNQLSGGEAQRVLVAISLASKPSVLLMDETTSALDLNRKILMENSVKEFASKYGMGVLWITHDAEQIERMSS